MDCAYSVNIRFSASPSLCQLQGICPTGNLSLRSPPVSNVIAHNVLPLAAVGDFEAFHCQPSTNVDRSTALDLTTSAPIAANGC
jgi:hypothetical protein